MICKNCKVDISTDSNFCSTCGAKVIRNKLTAKNLSADISEEFLSYDNKFLKTFLALFKQPEGVINGYISGTRKKYIGVIQYFAISLTLAGIQIFLMNTFFQDSINTDAFVSDATKEALEKSKLMKDVMDDFFSFTQNYQNLIYIFSVPIGALATFIVYNLTGNKQFNFVEHTVVNMYYSAQTIIILSVVNIVFLAIGLDFVVLSTLATILSFLYYFYVFKRVFSLSYVDNLARMLIVLIIYSILFFIAIILVFGVIFLSQQMNG